MIQLKEYNPWADIVAQFGAGLNQGYSGAREFQNRLKMEKEKAEQEFELFKKYFSKNPSEKTTALGEPKMGQDELSFKDQLKGTEEIPSEIPSQEDSELQKAWLNQKYPKVMEGKRKEESMEQKKFEADREYHSKRSGKYLDEIRSSANGFPERDVAINSALAAVESGNMSPWGGDFWADILGLPQLRTSEGAALQASAKINLMGSLGKLSGGRPNQFIEKQIDAAFAKAGETKEAQKTKLLMSKTVLDLEKQRAAIADQLANEDREKYGYVREDIDSRVDAAMKPYGKAKMDGLAYELQTIREKEMSPERLEQIVKVTPGTPLTAEKAKVFLKKAPGKSDAEKEENALKMAKKAGYKIMEDSFYESL